jgi:uncharacterized protein YraI
VKKLVALGLLTLAFLALPCVAQPQVAYTSKDAHLRAGPARDYPVIAILPAGFEVSVQGCLSDYSWCDVIAGPNRGWVYAANLDYDYQGAYVPLLGYGAQIGIAVTGFILFDYWGSHYRERPFYRDRDRWANRPRPPRAPIVRPEPPRRGEPPRRLPPPEHGGPGGQHPQPPQHGRPGEQHPQPPPHGSPGGQHPQPPPRGRPGEEHPRPPQSDGPAVVRPRPQ